MANKLQRKLQAKQNRSWNFDLEEGMLDASKLSRIITQPLFPLSYKQEKDIARVTVPVTKSEEVIEAFSMAIGEDKTLYIGWANTVIAVPIK